MTKRDCHCSLGLPECNCSGCPMPLLPEEDDQSQGLTRRESVEFLGVVVLCFALLVTLGSCVVSILERSPK